MFKCFNSAKHTQCFLNNLYPWAALQVARVVFQNFLNLLSSILNYNSGRLSTRNRTYLQLFTPNWSPKKNDLKLEEQNEVRIQIPADYRKRLHLKLQYEAPKLHIFRIFSNLDQGSKYQSQSGETLWLPPRKSIDFALRLEESKWKSTDALSTVTNLSISPRIVSPTSLKFGRSRCALDHESESSIANDSPHFSSIKGRNPLFTTKSQCISLV